MVPDFPYIKAVTINDCYTYKDLYVQVFEEEPFRHLILTGKNGSGKTTILNGIAYSLEIIRANTNPEKIRATLQDWIKHNKNHPQIKNWEASIERLQMIGLEYSASSLGREYIQNKAFVYSYFRAYRKTRANEVTTVTKDADLESTINAPVDINDSSIVYDNSQVDQRQFSQYFKQYLVNKKVSQAFDQLESNQQGLQQTRSFFDSFTDLLRILFGDKDLQLIFAREQFEFFINLSDGRKITFNQLSEGFSAFLSVITELLMRVDFIRRGVGDFSVDPPGIVLIDEPETHLHLELQYHVLPILTKLFPNIQFIAATHSPAVISSIPNATIYDLSSQVTRKEQVAGSSFSELMLTHFGLENEFSPVADKIIEQVNGIIENVQDKQAAKVKLKQILDANREVLTPSLQLELESAILELEND